MVTTAEAPSVETTLEHVQARIQQSLQELAQVWQRTAGRQADVLGERDLPWLIDHAAGGGKMIRPQMAHWGWVCAGAPPEVHDQVVDLGAAIELLHLFALIHDDVMDRSELRRGQATTHALARRAHERAQGLGDSTAFGDAIAILAGDLVHAEAAHLVAGLPRPVRDAWRTMMVELVLGQRRDLTGAALGRRDLAHALEVARLKSGAYTVSGPLRMGAILAGGDAEMIGALERYAWHVGEAFGLRDDLLGMWGDPAHTGKSVDDDLSAGKATVLLALAHDLLSEAGQDLLARAGSSDLDHDGLVQLRDEMARCGVRKAVEQMVTDEVALACAQLDTRSISPEGRAGLSDLAHRIAWRQS